MGKAFPLIFLYVFSGILGYLRFAGGDSIHGGTFIAMAGEKCVVLASDGRFSSHSSGTFLIGEHPRDIYRIGTRTLLGSFGLDSDARALTEVLRMKFHDHEDTDIQPSMVSEVISDELFTSSGLICSPIIAGLSRENEPYLCAMDGLGAQTVSDTFSITGTASEGLLAICESWYQPNLPPEKLVTLVARCMREALNRDAVSGCKIHILTMTPGGIYRRVLDSADV